MNTGSRSSIGLGRAVCGLVLVAMLMGGGGCSIRVATAKRELPAADGYPLSVYRLKNAGLLGAGDGRPRAVVVYITGSEDQTVLSATPHLAGLTAMGMSVYAAERRGVGPDGVVDPAAARAGCDKPTRVSDSLRVVEAAAAGAPPGTPVLVIGSSEGGDVAAAVARRSPVVTHLMLMGCGGGLTQIEGMRLLVERHPGIWGVDSLEEFDAAVARIRQDPASDAEWLGHPHRRWSTFAFERVGDDVEGLMIPVLLMHGGRDRSVPVEDARALAEAMRASGRSTLTYVEYADLDHSFRDEAGESGFPRLEIDTLRWFAATGLLTAAEAERAVKRVKRAHPGAAGTR